MLNKPNSKKPVIAATALAVALALLMAASQPLGVAANSASAQQKVSLAGLFSTLQTAAAQIYHGSGQLAQEIRSLYSVYQLLTSPQTPVSPNASVAQVREDAPSIVACRDHQSAREKQEKRKRRA